MPLGQRAGDKSDSRYCGVETEFDDDMPNVLTYNLAGGFDFVLAPLIRQMHVELCLRRTQTCEVLHNVRTSWIVSNAV